MCITPHHGPSQAAPQPGLWKGPWHTTAFSPGTCDAFLLLPGWSCSVDSAHGCQLCGATRGKSLHLSPRLCEAPVASPSPARSSSLGGRRRHQPPGRWMGSTPGQITHGRQFSEQLTEAKQILNMSKGGLLPVPHAMLPLGMAGEVLGVMTVPCHKPWQISPLQFILPLSLVKNTFISLLCKSLPLF